MNKENKIKNKTKFFRVVEAYDALKDYMSKYEKEKDSLNYLCLGCSTGEDVYSFIYYFSDIYEKINAKCIDSLEEKLSIAKQGIYVITQKLYDEYSELFEKLDTNETLEHEIDKLYKLSYSLEKKIGFDHQIKDLANTLNTLYTHYKLKNYKNTIISPILEELTIVKISEKYYRNVEFIKSNITKFLKQEVKNQNKYDIIQSSSALLDLPFKKRKQAIKNILKIARYIVSTDGPVFEATTNKKLSILYEKGTLYVYKTRK